MQTLDITVTIRPGMIIYEGDPDVGLQRTASIAEGAICNVSRLDLGVHTGTHIDAPVHFIEGGVGAEATPLDALMGPAYVVDATGVDADIDEETLGNLDLPLEASRVLFKTPNSELWSLPRFSPDFFGLTEGAARALAERGLRLVALDYLSVAPKSDPAPTHLTLLSDGIVILEGIDLRNVEPGWYELICLPLLIEGADGAPARALLRRD